MGPSSRAWAGRSTARLMVRSYPGGTAPAKVRPLPTPSLMASQGTINTPKLSRATTPADGRPHTGPTIGGDSRVGRSHSLIALSDLLVAGVLPSGLNATVSTGQVW